MAEKNPIAVEIPAGTPQFRLHMFENRGFKPGGDEWIVTQDGWQTPTPPNDEITAFKLSGSPGIHVELFNDKVPNHQKTWGEATLSAAVTSVDVPNLRNSVSVYVHHKAPHDDNLDGKVSLVVIR